MRSTLPSPSQHTRPSRTARPAPDTQRDMNQSGILSQSKRVTQAKRPGQLRLQSWQHHHDTSLSTGHRTSFALPDATTDLGTKPTTPASSLASLLPAIDSDSKSRRVGASHGFSLKRSARSYSQVASWLPITKAGILARYWLSALSTLQWDTAYLNTGQRIASHDR